MAKIDQLVVGNIYRYATWTGGGVRTDRGNFGEFVHIETTPGPSWGDQRPQRRAVFRLLGSIAADGSVTRCRGGKRQARDAIAFDVVPFDPAEYLSLRAARLKELAEAKARAVAQARELVPALRVLAAATGDAGHSAFGPFLYRDWPRTDRNLRTDDELAEHLATASQHRRKVDLLDVLRAAAEVFS